MTNRQLAPRNNGLRFTLFATLSLSLLLVAGLTLAPASRATRQSSRAPARANQKRKRPEFVPGDVLVRYKSEALAKRQATTVNAEGRAIPMQVKRFSGSDVIDGLRLAHVAPEDTLNAIAALKARPDVLYAEPNYILHADLTPNDSHYGLQYNWPLIGAPQAWDITTGSNNVVVGVIDQGIDINHPDLQPNIWTNPAPGSISGITGDLHGYSFVDNSGTIPAEDHATHVAGIIGAVGNNNLGVVGVNWNVKLMSLRFLDGAGNGNDSNAIRACVYAKQMKDLWISSGGTQGANIRAVNNSYGGGGFTQAFLDAINALNQSGILFFASDGNEGLDSDAFPHFPSGYNAPNVVSLVATNSGDLLANFGSGDGFNSNFGAQTATLGAPGVNVLSTTTKTISFPDFTDGDGNTYCFFSGTSMASPHLTGAAALLCAQNPNLTVQQLKSLLIFNGDLLPSLSGKTLTGRRVNVFKSLQALAENDVTPPGKVSNFQITSQSGRDINLGWTASGDDGAVGQASLYQVSFTDANTGAVVPLKNIAPPASGTPQTLAIKVPIGHNAGTFSLREFDNVGNEGTPATAFVSISFVDSNPYATALGKNVPLSTGGTHLNFNCDDCFKNPALPFSFPFFGQNFTSVRISSNGNLYFPPPSPPTRQNGDADDVPSSTGALASFRMISGLWDDIYLGTDQRADADVYVVQPDANRIIFRWQGVPCNDNGQGCTFGGPINFEVELRSNGLIQTRFGDGNTNLFPVVGISAGEPDAYVLPSLTSESFPTNLTNAPTVTYIPRTLMNPDDFTDFFVTQHYRDFLSREPDPGGEAFWIDQFAGCGTNQSCINAKRVDVSNAFFYELEFQQTAAYVYRVYREAFGNSQPFPNPFADPNFPGEDLKIPSYAKFSQDRALVVGSSNLAQSQLDYANAFVQRPEFIARYPASLSTAAQFVDAVLATVSSIGVDLSSQRQNLINLYGTLGRGGVIYRLADDNTQTNPINNRPLIDAEYNRAFVYGEYGGYLRRDSDIAGFRFWLNQVNSGPLRDVNKQHAMVCAFVNSDEYQLRFSTIITHNSFGDCPH
jgi:subtilisin family serine protease